MSSFNPSRVSTADIPDFVSGISVFLSSLAGVSAEKPIKEKVKNRNVRDVLSTLPFSDHLFTEIINFSAPVP